MKHILFSFLTMLTLNSFIWVEYGVEPSNYITSINEKNEVFQKDVWSGDVHYMIGYIPKELQVIQAMKRGTISEIEAQKWLKGKEKEVTLLFQIEIPVNGRQEFLTFEKDSTTYEERVKYFSFGFKNDIHIVENNLTEIGIVDYHFERDFGLSPKGTISISFNLSNQVKTLQFKFDDKVYGNGVISVDFDIKEIKKLPKLKDPTKWKNLN
ncbi:MAG: hypothetical protein EP305_04485 [Bacteroidetes bacterium]|nr:MAG: hypothetical protein EP305_04485 [Bacteroidota bacterium]